MASRDQPADAAAFNLSGDSDEFKNKKTDVFGSLDALEKSYQSNLTSRSESDTRQESRDQSDVSDVTDSFKRPRSPIRSTQDRRSLDSPSRPWTHRGRKRNEEPDFETNPSKWKRYSLEDTDVCGNAQNSRVAIGIVRDLKERREQGPETQKADLDQKVVFTKPAVAASQEKEKKFSDVHRMEEFNFGTKVIKKRTEIAKNGTDQSAASGSLSFEDSTGENDEYSGTGVQSDRSTETEGQSEESEDVTNVPAVQPGDNQVDDGQAVSVGFKKRKGQRNIRNRHDGDD